MAASDGDTHPEAADNHRDNPPRQRRDRGRFRCGIPEGKAGSTIEPVTLTTERLLLRALETTDTDAVHAACQDPEILRWTTVPAPYTREHAVEFIERTAPTAWRDDTGYDFGVFTREDGGTLVGMVGLLRLAQVGAPQRQAELGYWTVREHRRRGHTAEAGLALCRWAFERLGVERMEWCAAAGNEGSRAVARRIGFVMEGTARAKIVHRGTRRDAWTGSLLPSDLGLESATAYLPHAR